MIPDHAVYVLVRTPCDWCSSPYKPTIAAVETATTVGGAIARLCDPCADLIGTGPRIALRDAADASPLLTEAEAASYVAAHFWTLARTVPEDPHEYLLLHRSTDPYLHLRVIRFIRAHGEARPWRDRRIYHYWRSGDYEYWAMGPADTMINRRVIGATP